MEYAEQGLFHTWRTSSLTHIKRRPSFIPGPGEIMQARCAAAALVAIAVAAGVCCVDPPRSVLEQGASLGSGQVLTDGTTMLYMQSDCNLVLFANTIALWMSGTADLGYDCVLKLNRNGDLVISDSHGVPKWYTVNRAIPSDGPFQLQVVSQTAFIVGKFETQPPDSRKRIIIWSTNMF